MVDYLLMSSRIGMKVHVSSMTTQTQLNVPHIALIFNTLDVSVERFEDFSLVPPWRCTSRYTKLSAISSCSWLIMQNVSTMSPTFKTVNRCNRLKPLTSYAPDPRRKFFHRTWPLNSWMANDFVTFFEDKIKKVRDKLDNIHPL